MTTVSEGLGVVLWGEVGLMQDRWMNQEDIAIIQSRNGDLDHSGSSGVDEKWLYSR